ncbi:putative proteoglycan 4-like 6 [Homarus americanus]|uniref:Putative proteoglycan 4-like 6 n=2 Tax=Homarus americanus TaxID=6706 RepID=A0A8J5MZ77_HOMAM|nr:putative proteoglycan 4-like 6 [Homarus americanus]
MPGKDQDFHKEDADPRYHAFHSWLYLPPPRPRNHAGRGRRAAVVEGETMMVSLGVQQLVTASPSRSSHITVDTEGDNLLMEVSDTGRVVLPLREARPMVEEVQLDYGTPYSKALIKNEYAPVEEEVRGEPKYSYLKSERSQSSSSTLTTSNTLLLSLMFVGVVVGVVAAAFTFVRPLQSKNTGVLTA